MFPGYVLVQSEAIRDLVSLTRNCNDIYRYLESEGEFQKVPIEEIAMILQMINNEGIIDVSEICVEDGWYEVISGPLKGLEGKIQKLDKYRHRAKIQFMFNGEIRYIALSIKSRFKGSD